MITIDSLSVLGLGGCATVQQHPKSEPYDLAAARDKGDLAEIPVNALRFERGF